MREIGVFNTTTTAFCVGVSVATATGTQVGAMTEYAEDETHTPLATAFTSQSSASTIAAMIRQSTVGAAAGAGAIFTFGENGL